MRFNLQALISLAVKIEEELELSRKAFIVEHILDERWKFSFSLDITTESNNNFEIGLFMFVTNWEEILTNF